MSPNQVNRNNNNKKTAAADNLYTALLGLAFGVTLATAGYVAFACYTRYDTLFSIGRVFGY